jgi:hypothetical protein
MGLPWRLFKPFSGFTGIVSNKKETPKSFKIKSRVGEGGGLFKGN